MGHDIGTNPHVFVLVRGQMVLLEEKHTSYHSHLGTAVFLDTVLSCEARSLERLELFKDINLRGDILRQIRGSFQLASRAGEASLGELGGD